MWSRETGYEVALVGSLLTLFIVPPGGFTVLFVGAAFAAVNLYQKAKPVLKKRATAFKWWYVMHVKGWTTKQNNEH